MAKIKYNIKLWVDDAAGFAADETVYAENDFLFTSDTGVLKKGNGEDVYADLSDIASVSTWAGMAD